MEAAKDPLRGYLATASVLIKFAPFLDKSWPHAKALAKEIAAFKASTAIDL